MASAASQPTHATRAQPSTSWRGWLVAFSSIWILMLFMFFMLPWSIEGKALAVLHGLCAQQPGHTYYFGDARLPFDARMTGIYGGFACTSLVLLMRGRWRAAGMPPLWVIAILGLGIGLLALDGFNSTLRDLGLWYGYPPHNSLRLFTGLLTGMSLGVFLWLMLAQVGFRREARRRRAAVRSGRDMLEIAVVMTIFAAIVHTGWSVLRIPLTLVLIAAAVCAILGLVLSFVLLLSGRDGRAHDSRELIGPATIALLSTLVIIGGMSAGRFILEAWLAVPSGGNF